MLSSKLIRFGGRSTDMSSVIVAARVLPCAINLRKSFCVSSINPSKSNLYPQVNCEKRLLTSASQLLQEDNKTKEPDTSKAHFCIYFLNTN